MSEEVTRVEQVPQRIALFNWRMAITGDLFKKLISHDKMVEDIKKCERLGMDSVDGMKMYLEACEKKIYETMMNSAQQNLSAFHPESAPN
jgi:hypothetical protein